jgi:hypothetical protein
MSVASGHALLGATVGRRAIRQKLFSPDEILGIG